MPEIKFDEQSKKFLTCSVSLYIGKENLTLVDCFWYALSDNADDSLFETITKDIQII